ncbi:MAG: hypothetical protein IJO74_01630 [Clostridia bacterium]|nr:hypothetical protein [Clostridia bacterium]
MKTVSKQVLFAVFLFVCSLMVVTLHLCGYSTSGEQTVPYALDGVFSHPAVLLPSQNTENNISSRKVHTAGGLPYITGSFRTLSVARTVLIMLIGFLFIKPDNPKVEFIFDSDGKK